MGWIGAIDDVTGEVLYGGPDDGKYDVVNAAGTGLSPGQSRVVFPRKVVRGIEKYSGNPVEPIQTKTPAEIDAYDAAATSARVIAEVDAPVTAAVIDSVAALVAEHGPGSGDEWSASDLRQHVIDALTPLL